MIPSPVIAVGRSILRHWKAAGLSVLLLIIAMLKLSLASEQRHSAKLEQRLVETAAVYDQFRADVAARTALARAQDESHARRVESDQTLVNQETFIAYQKELAALRVRAARGLQPGASTADSGRGGGPAMPGVPDTASGADEATGEDRLSPTDALIANEIAIRLKALQAWIIGQEDVKR